jgi:hypothetical protein
MAAKQGSIQNPGPLMSDDDPTFLAAAFQVSMDRKSQGSQELQALIEGQGLIIYRFLIVSDPELMVRAEENVALDAIDSRCRQSSQRLSAIGPKLRVRAASVSDDLHEVTLN